MRVSAGRTVLTVVLLCGALGIMYTIRNIQDNCEQRFNVAVRDKTEKLTKAVQALHVAEDAKASMAEEAARLTSDLDRERRKEQELLQRVLSLERTQQQAVGDPGQGKWPLQRLQRQQQRRQQQQQQQQQQQPGQSHQQQDEASPGQHKLALVIPYRNARAELGQFVPHMQLFLAKQGVPFEVVVVNQVDDYRFNRGLLANIGFLKAEQLGCDYIALHDVDLLPQNDKLQYTYPLAPRHVSAPWLHPNYHYKTFIGGILLMNAHHFRKVDGLSTRFWGWGREDDELYKRIVEQQLQLERPPKDIGTDSTNSFVHLHDEAHRPRDMMKIGNQYTEGKQRDTSTGLSTTPDSYDLVGQRDESIGGVTVHFYDVKLKCNIDDTPWCKTPKECKKGYYKQFIRDDPLNRFVCKRCAFNCWRGFVLVGKCTETDTPVCMKIGRDISEEEAAKWPEGTIVPH